MFAEREQKKKNKKKKAFEGKKAVFLERFCKTDGFTGLNLKGSRLLQWDGVHEFLI